MCLQIAFGLEQRNWWHSITNSYWTYIYCQCKSTYPRWFLYSVIIILNCSMNSVNMVKIPTMNVTNTGAYMKRDMIYTLERKTLKKWPSNANKRIFSNKLSPLHYCKIKSTALDSAGQPIQSLHNCHKLVYQSGYCKMPLRTKPWKGVIIIFT